MHFWQSLITIHPSSSRLPVSLCRHFLLTLITLFFTSLLLTSSLSSFFFVRVFLSPSLSPSLSLLCQNEMFQREIKSTLGSDYMHRSQRPRNNGTYAPHCTYMVRQCTYMHRQCTYAQYRHARTLLGGVEVRDRLHNNLCFLLQLLHGHN